MQRLTLAEIMRADPRPLKDAVLDHVHTLDAIAQDARLATIEEGGFTATNVQKAVDTATAALRADKLAMDIGVTKLVLEKAQRDADVSGQWIASVLVAIKDKLVDFLAPLPDPRTSPQPYARAIEFRETFGRWMLEAAHAALSGREIPDPPAPSLVVALLDGAQPVVVQDRPAATSHEDSGLTDDVYQVIEENEAAATRRPLAPAEVTPIRPARSGGVGSLMSQQIY